MLKNKLKLYVDWKSTINSNLNSVYFVTFSLKNICKNCKNHVIILTRFLNRIYQVKKKCLIGTIDKYDFYIKMTSTIIKLSYT